MSAFGEKFCLKWNNFQQNIATSYRELREAQDFSDVTLVCEEDQQIKAHRVILSAFSPIFMSILKTNKHSHPLIYMRNIKIKDLIAIVDFMYHGEVNIYQKDLDSFLASAEDLKLTGLSGGEPEDFKPMLTPKVTPKQHISTETFTTNNAKGDDQDSDTSTYNKEIVPNIDNALIVSVVNIDELDEKIDTMMGKVEKGPNQRWNCNVCGKIARKDQLRQHIEANHIKGPSHSCLFIQCGKFSR